MSVIFYSSDQETNRLSILAPVEGVSAEQLAAQMLPVGTQYCIADSPHSFGVRHDYFSAYRFVDGQVTADLGEVKSIHVEKLREARVPLFAALDTAYFKALESGDTAKMQNISAAKQALRDLPDQPLPPTAEEVMDFWPTILTQDPEVLANDPTAISASAPTVS